MLDGSKSQFKPFGGKKLVMNKANNVRNTELDWSVCICLTQLYVGRDMYRIYYIKNNYMFRHCTLAIFRLIIEKLSKQLHSTCVGCIQWGGQG